MPSSGMLHLVVLVRTDVWEECIASIIRITRIGELGAALTVTSNRHTLRSYTTFGFSHSISSLHASVAMLLETSVLKELHGITSQKTAFFMFSEVLN
jgi:hypothetical protein